MSGPYSTGWGDPNLDPEERGSRRLTLGRVVVAVHSVWSVGMAFVGSGTLFGAVWTDPKLDPSLRVPLAGAVGVVSALLLSGLAVWPIVTWVGLGRRRPWARTSAILLGGIMLPSCLPMSATLLYAMLNEETSKLFRRG